MCNSVHSDRDKICLAEFVCNFRCSNLQNNDGGLDWKLNVTRLEAAWFLFRLVLTLDELNLLNSHSFAEYTTGNRRNIELFRQKLCSNFPLLPQGGCIIVVMFQAAKKVW